MIKNEKKKEVESNTNYDYIKAQKDLCQSIDAVVKAGNYEMITVLAAFEMMKFEYSARSFFAHQSKMAEQNLIKMQNNKGMTPEMLERIRKSSK